MRIIARLDIKLGQLIKSIMYEGVRQLGDPEIFAQKYYDEGIDELVFINNTGSLYNTKLDLDLIKQIRKNKAIPITGGGGIKNLKDACDLIEAGCDKVIINSLIHTNINEVEKIISTLGSSSVIGAIQYDKKDNKYISLYEMARETTNLDLNQTILKYKNLGIGELLVTDVNRDGCYTGLNEEILDILAENKYNFPLLVSGGMVNPSQLDKFKNLASGLVLSSALHYNKLNVKDFLN